MSLDLWADVLALPFLQRALVELVVLGLLCAVIGVHIVLRRSAFAADTMTHTVFPGIVIAFLLGGSVLLGALISGLLSGVLLVVATAARRVRQDAALAILLTSFFALGVVLVSRTESYTANLERFLFGSLLTVDRGHILTTVGVAVGVLLVLGLLHKELVLGAFDPVAARALGYRTVALDLVLTVLLALVVVVSVRAVGTVLVIALLVVPAVTARSLTDRLMPLVALAAGVGVLGAIAGLLVSVAVSISYDVRLAAGASVAAALVVIFVLVMMARWVWDRVVRGRVAARLAGRPA